MRFHYIVGSADERGGGGVNVDVVVVGAGSSGVTVGCRLSEDPGRSVLVLEAGLGTPLFSDADLLSNVSFATSHRDWALRAQVSAGRELDYPQGKFVGGGSSVNGALAFRGAPEDFEGWVGRGNPSWGWPPMLEAYRRLEHDLDFGPTSVVHGDDGPVPIVRWHEGELVDIQRAFREACLAQGYPWTDDHNDPTSTGIGSFPMNRAEGRRMSTALTYLQAAQDRPNLHLWSGAQVHRVVLSGSRATGVILDRGGNLEEVTAGEVVLCAGSIQTPALLWRSGIGPPEELAALGIETTVANRAVGANLTDHPGVFYFVAPGARRAPFSEPQYQLGARYTSTDATDGNDMFLSMMNYWDLAGSPDFQAMLGVDSVVVFTCGVHQPESRGRVWLTSADPAVAPRIELNLLDDPRDVGRLVEGVRRCAALARHDTMADFVGGPLLFGGDLADDEAVASYVRAVVAPWYHPVGTCRMGPDDNADAVVGDDLRVHGIDDLRVADASIMPRITRAPTNLTAIAIGERAASFIAAG
ncbi:MAG: GMC family oxidoreductase N-terminal domain-containing protein [Acidimicrobiales bacterium]